jgi:spoIIIJ-associated protein
MKDLVFTAGSVPEAVASAVDTLGVAPEGLRYVVLDPGEVASGRSPARPARIAVLVVGAGADKAAPGPEPEIPGGLEECLGGLTAALGRAAGVEARFALTEDDEALTVRISTSDNGFLWGSGGEVFEALEHIVHRVAARFAGGRRVAVRDDAYRDRRDAALRCQAQEAAAEVRRDGQPRELRKLNSYERRVIHVALEGEEGVRTRSVGSGEQRVLLVEPARSGATDET